MAEKEFESEDPFTLTGMVLSVSKEEAQSAEDEMAACFIEEYILLGYCDDEIVSLFKNSFYQATYAIYQKKGEEYVRQIIHKTRFGDVKHMIKNEEEINVQSL